MLLFVTFLCLALSRNITGLKLIIDHDGGSDDALAITIACIYEKYFGGPEIIAISTVHGNVNESQAFINTQKTLSLAKRFDIPIYRGSEFALIIDNETDSFFGNDGLGDVENHTYTEIRAQPEHAAVALVELAKRYQDKVIVLSIGSLTNIAVALSLDPQFISRLNQLYVAAGTVQDETYHTPEFNVVQDTEAYYKVVQNSDVERVTFIPYSPIKATKSITVDWRVNVLGAIQTETIQQFNLFERKSLQNIKPVDGVKYWLLLDVVAMSMVLNSNLIEEYKYSNTSVILYGEGRSLTPNQFTTLSAEANAKLAYPSFGDELKEFIYRIFTAELMEKQSGDRNYSNNL